MSIHKQAQLAKRVLSMRHVGCLGIFVQADSHARLNSLAATTRKGGIMRLPGAAPRPARMRVASLNCSTLMGAVTPASAATARKQVLLNRS